MPKLAAMIGTHDGIVVAVSVEILVGQCRKRSGNDLGIIRVNKPTNLRVVVSAVEVIETAFIVIDISPIAEGAIFEDGANLRVDCYMLKKQ